MGCKNCGHTRISHYKNVDGWWVKGTCSTRDNDRSCKCEEYEEME